MKIFYRIKSGEAVCGHYASNPDRRLDFFLKNSFGQYVKNDERKEWLTGLISMVQKKMVVLSDEEKTYVWDCLNKMLECVVQYRITMGDFSS